MDCIIDALSLNKTSIFFTIICSGIHRITEVIDGRLFAVNMGFPFQWMEKYVYYEQLFEPMNCFQITKISYQVIVFALNCLIFYCFMVGVKNFFNKQLDK